MLRTTGPAGSSAATSCQTLCRIRSGMKMRLQKPLACTVLLAFSAFDCAPDGSWTTVCTEALHPSQLRSNEAVYRRCPGSLTCPRRRHDQQEKRSTLRHQGDHYVTEEARLRHPLPQALVEERDNKTDRFKVVTEAVSQRQDHLKDLEIHHLESAVEQFPESVPRPCFIFEQANNCVRDAINSDVRKKQLKESGMPDGMGHDAIEKPRARERWQEARQNILDAQEWEAHGSKRTYLPPDAAFVLLNQNARLNEKMVIKRTAKSETGLPSFSSENLAESGEKSGTHYIPPHRSSESPSRSCDDTRRDAVISREAIDMSQDPDSESGSFLHKYFVRTPSTHIMPAEEARELARSVKQKTSRCTASVSACQPVQYDFLDSAAGGKGATKQANWHKQISSTLRFEALTDAGRSSQRRKYNSHRTDVVPADAFSLIDLWSGASHQASNIRQPPYGQRNAANVYSRMQIREQNSLLNHDSLVTITYHFPFHTAETHSIAFILVALPPGYTARENGELCTTSDVRMPALSCRIRHVDIPEREDNFEGTGKKRTVFVQVSSADHGRELPLGTHRFSVWVRNPPHRLAVGLPKNWWFVTFRFSPGHTVTKHFENGLLHEKRKCAWTSWRQETPCSASCGPGFEMWTRSLLAGDDGACGPEIVKRKCELVPCNVNCQLGPWETVIDCTKSCLAKKGAAFQLSIRKVLLDKQGLGTACKELYPWNSKLQQGWSDKLRLVIRRTPCPDIFAKECPADLGCRVEHRIKRTMTVAYPWGSCPFPCGGIGLITSIIQVANGIPRWIGERDFPQTFQAPCRADKEPIVTRQRCNTFACEDCSVYVEAPTHGRVARAWFFFLPSQEADIVIVTIPPGVTFALADSTAEMKYRISEAATKKHEELEVDEKPAPQQTSESTQISPSSEERPDDVGDTVRKRSVPQTPMPEQNLEEIFTENGGEDESDTTTAAATKERGPKSQSPENTLCRHLRASFGRPSRCDVRASTRYPRSQEIVFRLDEHIVPPYIRPVDQHSQYQIEDEAHRSKRPEWLVVPLRISDEVINGNRGNFYMWLMSSHTPRDPEVFTCQVKTPLHAPIKCQYKYFPVHPEDCDKCSQQSNSKILMLRRFLPPKHGGTCNVPQERWQLDVVLVTTTCAKGCAEARNRAQQKGFFLSPRDFAVGKQRNDTSALHFGRSSFEDRRHFPFAGASAIRSVLSLETLREPVRFRRHNRTLMES